ncbi:hypothetical protein EMMF5_000017 [Cystobasidiomycetes sp. EMM_F5]
MSAPNTTESATGSEQPGFVQQAKGYAKQFAGQAFGKPHEVAQGKAVREGQLEPHEAVQQITPETHPKGTDVSSTGASGAAPGVSHGDNVVIKPSA